MKILSWDIGIKNLSYCLLENNTISDWDVINLDNEIDIQCNGTFKNGSYNSSNDLCVIDPIIGGSIEDINSSGSDTLRIFS